MTLFPDFDVPTVEHPERDPGLSAGRRLTLRQRADVTAGRHPLMRGPLAGNGETCGTCVHRVLVQHNRTYPKCDLTSMTCSAASDCRAWWPACPRWEQR